VADVVVADMVCGWYGCGWYGLWPIWYSPIEITQFREVMIACMHNWMLKVICQSWAHCNRMSKSATGANPPHW